MTIPGRKESDREEVATFLLAGMASWRLPSWPLPSDLALVRRPRLNDARLKALVADCASCQAAAIAVQT
jgi:hypothetical protein